MLPSGAGLLMTSQHFLYAFAWGIQCDLLSAELTLLTKSPAGPDILKTACLPKWTQTCTLLSCCPLSQPRSSLFERCLPLTPGNNNYSVRPRFFCWQLPFPSPIAPLVSSCGEGPSIVYPRCPSPSLFHGRVLLLQFQPRSPLVLLLMLAHPHCPTPLSWVPLPLQFSVL